MLPKKVSIMICISLAIILIACSTPAAPASSQPQKSPESVVTDFYAWYLGDRASGPKDATDSPTLSPELIDRVQSTRKSGNPDQMINFVCAQDFPESMAIEDTTINGQEATVKTKNSFGRMVTLQLKVNNGEWKISDVSCK